MLNIRTVILSVVLVLILILTVRWLTARTEAVSDSSNGPASVLDNQERSANQNKVDYIHSYRSRLGECFDVSLSELAGCRNVSQMPVPSYRSHLDQCFDVSLSERARCRNASRAPDPSYRSRLDECFDVSLIERASCRNANQAIIP